MSSFLLDLRHSLRTLLRGGSFAAVAVAVLALGLGANIAVFTVVYSVLLKPLEYREPDRLVVALHDGRSPVSPADFADYKAAARSFEQLEAAQAWGGNIVTSDRAEALSGLQVTSGMMHLLGVPAAIGRTFESSDDNPDATPVVLLSHGLWLRVFGGDPGIVGKIERINGKAFAIIGVMPAEFHFAPFWSTQAEMWTILDLRARADDRGGRSLRVFGRLKPGYTVERAQAEMDGIAARLAADYPRTNAKLGITVMSLREKVTGAIRPTLLVLLGTVGFVLLIACANVANLMLTRAVGRRRELALRLALGASRIDLLRQTLVETTLLSLVGAVAGMMLAGWTVDAIKLFLPPGSLARQQELALHPAVFGFGLALALLTGFAAGLLPALSATRGDVNNALKDGARGTSASAGRGRTRRVLVTVEVALALVLLTGAGLMMRTLDRLNTIDAGFDPGHLLTFEVSTQGTSYDTPAKRALLFDRLTQTVAAIPGVASVSAINHLPVAGDLWTLGYKVEGRPEQPPGEGFGAAYRVVRPRYFETMRIPLDSGREFSESDNENAPPVAIVNEAMARRQWPHQNPVGQIVVFNNFDSPLRLTVVGVSKNARQDDWISEPGDELYLPYLQRPGSMGLSGLSLVVRTRVDPAALSSTVRDSVQAFDHSLPISHLASMEQLIADKLWRSRLSAVLILAFALVALALAAIGIFSVISFTVRQRTHEIGVRMALGAGQRDVLRMTLLTGMAPVAAGTVLGLIASLGATRMMTTLLYGVEPGDPLTLAAVTVCLLGVALLANYLPSRRASRLDPLLALRDE